MLEGIDLENYVCEGQMDIETLLRGARTMNNGIFNIRLSKIKHHPNNPRRNIGDVTELAESIRKNGIMQNLTVMHDPDDPEGYICLIGHRRMTAAAQAGLEEVPCRVVQIDEKEQIAMMLQENIQRNDLTIPEQAYGFQYMFDLGASADEIAEKTGLNRSTVYHRLNIAKLDKEILEARAKDEDFQLTFKDLLELEKIEDIGKRNKLLKECTNRDELKRKVKWAVIDEKVEKNKQNIRKQLTEAGIEEAPEEFKKDRWSGQWERILTKYIYEDTTEITIPDSENRKFFYELDRDCLMIIAKNENEQEEKEKSDWQIKKEKQDACKKQLSDFHKHMIGKMKRNILLLIDDRLETVVPYAGAVHRLWDTLLAIDADISLERGASFFLKKGKNWYSAEDEETDAAESDWNDLDMIQQMAIFIYEEIENEDLWNYSGEYYGDGSGYVNDYKIAFKTFREVFGIPVSKAEEAFLDGTSELYYREEKDDE
ncbi:MAG: ParB/RepB/Spo0J family partition protein [Lachnospiraceae bacterium]|nr:ParB/RepB/Spo0J family partition protein [Lachnospiraceae bacterium]